MYFQGHDRWPHFLSSSRLEFYHTGHAATADKTAFPIAKNNVFGRQNDDRREQK